MRKEILLIIIILILGGCSSLSPGKNMVKKNETALEVAAGINSSPNIGFGIKYGLSDKLNLNMNVISPIMASDNLIIFEPSLIANIIEKRGFVPRVTCYLSIPTLYSLKQSEFKAYPLIGVAPKYEWGKWGVYGAIEMLSEFRNNPKTINLKLNIKTGIEYKINEKWALDIETGINNVGYKSPIADFGYPVLFFGTTIKR